MRKLLTVSVLSLALLTLAVRPLRSAPGTSGDVTVPFSKLTAQGVTQKMFRMMSLSGNGQVLLGAEKEKDFALRKQGMVYKARIFRTNGSAIQMDTLPLPFAIWDQSAVNENGSQAILVGELGTKILEVDLTTKAIRTLMEHQKGKPGFRCDPRICWVYQGNYYLVGYFYDADGVATPNVVVRLDLTRSGLDQFEKVLDLAHLEAKVCQTFAERIVVSPNEVVYIAPLKKNGQQDMIAVVNGVPKVIESAIVYGTFAASDSRVVYSIRTTKKPNPHEAWVQDYKTGKKWKIGQTDVPYSYAFISADGKTIAISRISLKSRRMSWYYAHDSDGYALKPLASLQNVGFGNFRFAKNGTNYAWLDHTSLRMGVIPQ